jgi:inhibitor of the pro-sigma K processing machinery
MVVGEILGLILAIIILVVLFRVVKNIGALIVNAVIGVVLLWILNLFLSPPVVINIWSVLISAIGGILGVIIVLLLHFLGIAF